MGEGVAEQAQDRAPPPQPLLGLRWQRRRRPTPAPIPTGAGLPAIDPRKTPGTRTPAQPAGPAHHSPWGPDPRPLSCKSRDPPNSSELHQRDVTHRTLGRCGHEPRAPRRPQPPGSLLPRRSPLKTMAAEAPMTAKKEAYSGPLLASDMSAGGERANSASRGRDGHDERARAE